MYSEGSTEDIRSTPRSDVLVPPIVHIHLPGQIRCTTRIDIDVLDQLPLATIDKVTFYKRDEIVTDLICCDIVMGESVRTFHEELPGWDALIQHLAKLPNFQTNWYASVSQPPFETSETVAFSRQ